MFNNTVTQIKQLLSTNNCWNQYFTHKEVKTSLEASKIRLGYSLNQGAKSLILKYCKKNIKYYAMFVLCGGDRLNIRAVKKALNTSGVTFATEEEIFVITNGVKIGGIPPFGNLFNISVYTDNRLINNNKVMVFNAGDRGVSIAMLTADYVKLFKPILGDYSVQ